MAEVKIVSQVEDGTRLLRWFGRHFPSMPNAEFHKLCRGGQIRLNSSRVRGTEILRAGDAIRIPPTISEYVTVNAKKTESGNKFLLADLEQLRKCIIHSDDDIVVFDKPAGLAVQGGTGIRKSIDNFRMPRYHWFIVWIGKQAGFWLLQKANAQRNLYLRNFNPRLRIKNIWHY